MIKVFDLKSLINDFESKTLIEDFESMGVNEIMPIFQAGRATHEEIMNSIRLFGKYVIPHFKEKEKRNQKDNTLGEASN